MFGNDLFNGGNWRDRLIGSVVLFVALCIHTPLGGILAAFAAAGAIVGGVIFGVVAALLAG